MSEIDVIVSAGRSHPLLVPTTTVDIMLLSGRAILYGWSFRDASGEIPTDIAGSVTSPAAGAVIAASAPQAGGTYIINWTVSLAGTVSASDVNNFGLYVGGTLIATSNNPGATGDYPQPQVEAVIPQGITYKVEAIAIGTVAAVYSVTATSQPQLGTQSVCEVRDINYPIGESAMVVGGTNSVNFGPQGVDIRGGILLHMISGAVAGNVYAKWGMPSDWS